MVEREQPPEHPDQPDLVQIAMLLIDRDDWSIKTRASFIVKLAQGVKIEPEAENIHGISAADCEAYGVAPVVAV